VLRAPELDAGRLGRSQQSRVEGQNHLPRPAAHAAGDAGQDTVGFPGCECTLLAHVKLFVPQHPQVLLSRAAFNPFIPQPAWISEDAPIKVQDPARDLVGPNEVHIGPFLELVQVPLHVIPFFWCVSCTTQLCVICKLAEGALDLLSRSLIKIFNSTGPNTDP